MSLLNWITRKHNEALDSDGALRHVQDKVSSIERKVADNHALQIQASSFSSIKERDDVIMQRIVGRNNRPTRDLAERLAVPPVWGNRGGDK